MADVVGDIQYAALRGADEDSLAGPDDSDAWGPAGLRQGFGRITMVMRDIEAAGGGGGGATAVGGLGRTRSMQADLDAGADLTVARKAAALRRQLRLVDADAAELRAALRRWDVLSGPVSVAVRECDADCIVGGCGESVPESDGVLCGGCGLFLCNRCFGQLVVANEAAVGGRYDRPLQASPPHREHTGGGADVLLCARPTQRSLCSRGSTAAASPVHAHKRSPRPVVFWRE